MGNVKIRYYKVRRNGRAFWEPTPTMRAAGFRSTPLGEDGPTAWDAAKRLNDAWDSYRRTGKRTEEPQTTSLSAKVYPAGSIGEAFQRYRQTAEWAKKPDRTREDWERGWTYIEPVFARFGFDDVTMDVIGEWRDAIEADKSLQEAHRALKIWRAFWKVSAAMRYCRRDDDPSLAIKNKAPKGRSETWREWEVVRIVKEALRRRYLGIAVGVAILWDSSASPNDVRDLQALQMHRDGSGTWFSYARGKTGRDGVITLSRRTEKLLEWYLTHQFGGAELMPTMKILRTRRGAAFTKNSFAEDFRDIRNDVFPGDTRQMRDFRRSGAVEAVAGGAQGFQLSAKLANSIGQSKRLEATYAPIQVETVRNVDEARRRGRRVLGENKAG